MRLEQEFQRQLQLPVAQPGGSDLSESWGAQYSVRRTELRRIEQIEGFQPELETLPFGHRKFFEEPYVPGLHRGLPESISSGRAEFQVRELKGVCVEPSVRIRIGKLRILPGDIVGTLCGAAGTLAISGLSYGERKTRLVGDDAIE